MLSLSLFLFNVLPFPYLDGAQLADALAEALRARSQAREASADLEAGVNGIGRGLVLWPGYRRLRTGVQVLMMLSMVISLLLGLFSTVQTAPPWSN